MYNPVGSEQAVPGTGLCKQLSTLSPYSQVFYPQPHPGTKQMEPASSQRSEQERAHQKPAGVPHQPGFLPYRGLASREARGGHRQETGVRQYQAWIIPQGHHVSNAVAHCPPGGYPQAVHGLPPQLVWLPQHFLQGSMPAAYLPQKAALQLQADNSRPLANAYARLHMLPSESERTAAGKTTMWRRVQSSKPASVASTATSVAGDAAPHSSASDSSCGQDAQAARQRTDACAASGDGPEVCAGWEWMCEPIMRSIVHRLDPLAQQHCRLVCRRWNHVFTNNLLELHIKRPKVHVLRDKFKSIEVLDLSGCENVRNRNLNILAISDLPLKSITIGHPATISYGKPRITNSALLFLSKMTGLQALSLSDCSAITNNGMQVLSALTNLTSLALSRCPRISEAGLQLVHSLPTLAALTVFGCTKVTEELLVGLGQVSKLTALHLGHMRLQPLSLAHLAGHPSLRELTIHGEELTSAALAVLSDLSRLTALGMTTCYQVSAPLALSMLQDMTALQRLNLQSFADLTDAHMSMLATRLTTLQQLKVVVGPSMSWHGIEALAELPHLHALGMECNNTAPLHATFGALSRLTRLSMLEVLGTMLPPTLLESVGRLPKLHTLSLANYEPAHMLRHDRTLRLEDVAPLARCSLLRRLDLSHLCVTCHLAVLLLKTLTARDGRAGNPCRLEELCLFGCHLEEPELVAVRSMFPSIHIHMVRRRMLPSSTYVWGPPA